MSRSRRSLIAAAVCACAVGSAVMAQPLAAQSRICPATFDVLHNDRIGSLRLPGGTYTVQVEAVSCSRASSLFVVFLNDYDGILPGGWTVTARSRGRGTFRRGADSFTVRRRGRAPAGGGLTCTTPYQIATSTQAGLLLLPAGRYRLTRLSPVSPTCAQAAALLTSFLGQTQQVLPGDWISLFADGAFVQDSASYGFRVERL